MKTNSNSEVEEKAIIDQLIIRFKRILNLNKFEDTIDNAIATQYNNALQKVDNKFDLPLNIVPNSQDLRFMQEYVNDNLGAVADQVGNELRQEIQRGILNDDTKTDLINRVKKLFKDKKYQTRLKVILRTEVSRANNAGTLEGAKQAANTGLKIKKWLDVTMDARTSGVCVAEHSKYGSPDLAIPLDQDFVVKVDNKTIRQQAPPFLPNCRTVLRLEVEK